MASSSKYFDNFVSIHTNTLMSPIVVDAVGTWEPHLFWAVVAVVAVAEVQVGVGSLAKFHGKRQPRVLRWSSGREFMLSNSALSWKVSSFNKH